MAVLRKAWTGANQGQTRTYPGPVMCQDLRSGVAEVGTM